MAVFARHYDKRAQLVRHKASGKGRSAIVDRVDLAPGSPYDHVVTATLVEV